MENVKGFIRKSLSLTYRRHGSLKYLGANDDGSKGRRGLTVAFQKQAVQDVGFAASEVVGRMSSRLIRSPFGLSYQRLLWSLRQKMLRYDAKVDRRTDLGSQKKSKRSVL